ncbi:MAG: HNH endonuclease [Bacilli bacterium]|nr:HNH endonuclease [Bacilli bacterium]
MKIELSDYYKEKGFQIGYKWLNKENRYMVSLYINGRPKTLMTYAKYLYTSHYKCDIPKGEQIDHINGDKTDDRIENLQIISSYYNVVKDKKRKEMVECVCPICGVHFLFEKRNLPFKNNPCCSKKCGYIKVSQTLKNKDKKIKNIKKEDIEEILKLNITIKEMSKRLNISPNTFRKYRKEYNI